MVNILMKFLNEAKEKRWIVRSVPSDSSAASVAEISLTLGITPIIAKLLYNRGYTTPKAAKNFIYMENEMLSDPFQMKDMEKGIARIKKAVDSKERITVYGDYDVDGVTAVCTLYLYLKSIGANVSYYIPNRNGEGYGVSCSAVDTIKSTGTTLIITVDTGITAHDEVEYARTLGVDFLITDHHECHTELPNAVAAINPHRPDCSYPFKELAGVGVVFKVICAYEERYITRDRIKAANKIFTHYADLVAIGTIADVMPVRDENRIIIKYGLAMMENTTRVGLAALIEASSKKSDSQSQDKKKKKTKISSGFIGYTLAPRINAAGRIRSASMAVELFLAENYSDVYKIAEELCAANKERQNEENKIMEEAYKKIEELDLENTPVIVLDADNWHHGVIGIVASRITEKYGRPSILVSFEGNDLSKHSPLDSGKGSGRSIKGMNLVDALCHCEEHLLKYGGHELAAGLSVSRCELDNFRKKINDYALKNLTEEDMMPTLEADTEIEFEDINLALADGLRILEPYGVANPVPAFVLRGVTVLEINGVSGGKHTRITITNGKYSLSAMYFSCSADSLGIYPGDEIDILFNIDVNDWLGKRTAQIIVRDVRTSEKQAENEENDRLRFEQIRAGARIYKEENAVPTREDFACVYKFLLMSQRIGVSVLTHRDITTRLKKVQNDADIGYIKLKIIMMVFKELNLISIEEAENEVYKFNIRFGAPKTDLEKSSLLRKIRSQLRPKD